jgi:anti-anti-sigma factor
MQVTVLVRITPAVPAPRAALRAFVSLARRLNKRPGFHRLQTFKAMDATGDIMVLIDWDSADCLAATLHEEGIYPLLAEAAAWGYQIAPPEVLAPTFDRRLTGVETVATLLRLTACSEPATDAASRDCDLALQAMAAPGSTRLYGARRMDGRTALCRIDFDTEDGIWHFLESPLRRTWSVHAGRNREQETWALNLPRLEFTKSTTDSPRRKPTPLKQENLSVQLQVNTESGSARVRLEGRVGSHGSTLSEKFFQALINDGCRHLEVDVSGLSSMSAEAVGMLTRAARSLKARGGHFVLVDNEERVKRVTRCRHLETSLR